MTNTARSDSMQMSNAVKLHMWSLARQADRNHMFDSYEVDFFDTKRLRVVLETNGRHVRILIPKLLRKAPDEALVSTISIAYDIKTSKDERFDDSMIDYLLSPEFIKMARAECKYDPLCDYRNAPRYLPRFHLTLIVSYLSEFSEVLGSVKIRYRNPEVSTGDKLMVKSSILGKVIVIDQRIEKLLITVRRYVIFHELCLIASYDYRRMSLDLRKFERLLNRLPNRVQIEKECVRAGIVFDLNTPTQTVLGSARVRKS